MFTLAFSLNHRQFGFSSCYIPCLLKCYLFTYSYIHLKTIMQTGKQAGKLIAVIGNEETCIGFLLGGIGEVNDNREKNFLVVGKNTTKHEIDSTFKSFLKRQDIAIILIAQNVANMIRETVDAHVKAEPAVLEIPSKDEPYDVTKDSIMSRAKGLYNPDDV